MLNHITIMGRLTRDPELRRTGSGIAVTSFSVAVDRDYSGKDGEGKKVDFINCVAWRQTGEFVSKYFTKGRMIVVDGRLEMREWTDKDGVKRVSAEINVANAYFGDSKQSNGQNNGAAPSGGYQAPAPQQNGYNQPAPNYGAAQPAPNYGAAQNGYGGNGYGYPAPSPAAASDFAMLDDDDAKLPF